MTTLIGLLPFFIALFFVIYTSPEKAFLNVYIPVILLLPQIFSPEVPIFHNFNFSQSAAIPIFCGFFIFKFLTNRYLNVSYSITDLAVIVYVGICAYAEYTNTGDEFVYSLILDKTTSIIFPYFLAKFLIHTRGHSIDLAKRIVIFLIVDVILGLYEFRMGYNPNLNFYYLFFPSQGHAWHTIFRGGFTRIAGPFIHPILFAITIGVAIIFNYWLIKIKFWKRPFIVSSGKILMGILIMGIILTFSRGPMLGTCLGLLIATIGFSKNRRFAILWRLCAIVVAGIGLYEWFHSYTEITGYVSSSSAEGTALYRSQILEKYRKYVLQKPYWGWGFTTLPISEGLISIDNQYLWLALKHGIVALISYVVIFSTVFLRLCIRGVETPSRFYLDYSFALALAGAIIAMASSFFTVFMGLQIESIFFILIGWAEGFLLSKPEVMNRQLGVPR